jgi:DNA modification methylase
MAAERVGRICYGMEIDPLYVDTAIRRWQQQTGATAVHATSKKTFDKVVEERFATNG